MPPVGTSGSLEGSDARWINSRYFVDEEIFIHNTACTFIKHMKYDKAELVEIEAVLPTSVVVEFR